MGSDRILILTSGPLCRNPRVLKEATTLGRTGYEVTVLTLTDAERFEARDRVLLASAPFRKIAIALHGRSGRAGLGVFARRAGAWFARRLVRLGWETPYALGPAGPLGRRARAFAADLTIVHTELPFCLGVDLLSRGRRVAADFEDWHSRDLLPDAQTGRPLRLLTRVERTLLQRAAYTSTTSHALADALQNAFGGAPPVVLTNSFPLQPAPAQSARTGPPAFFWFSQTIGPGRGLEPFLAAWQQTQHPSRVSLLGEISDRYRAALLASLPPARRAALEFLPLVAPDALPEVIARHDIGLALEEPVVVSRDLTITNKILQYLNAGLAIVASDTAGQREVMARAPSAGVLTGLGDPTALAHTLDPILASRPVLAAMGAAARRAAGEFYCWEREEPRLTGAVSAALSRPIAT